MTKTIVRRTTSNTSAALSTLHPILQRIYLSRGLTESHELERDLKSLLPFHQLSGIDAAAQLLVSAIQTQKRILIIGDYDADGATSTVLAIRALRVFGAKYVDYVVPNRFEYGYGLSPEIVKFAAKKNPELIITVDNGISSIEGVELANQMGISVLITDHHLAGRQLPQAAAIVNPNQAHDLFPSKHLAGVGVIFYVMLALRAALREQQWFTTQQIAEPNMAEFLDVVALGTVADVVVLDKNNRILVHQGLKRIRAGQCSVGLRALTEIGKLQIAQLTTRDLGFVLGPRLNAAGRLEDMSLGIECLLCQDETRARQLAKKLDDLNHERRDIEEGMKQQAFKFLKDIHLGKNFPYGLCYCVCA
jgi:single-stranded-DNA-specific exonuclease